MVAYNIDGIPELVRHNVDGLLYESGNTNDLALGIISLLRDPEKSKEMGIAGRKKVNDHFLMEDMVKNHNKFFTGLI